MPYFYYKRSNEQGATCCCITYPTHDDFIRALNSWNDECKAQPQWYYTSYIEVPESCALRLFGPKFMGNNWAERPWPAPKSKAPK